MVKLHVGSLAGRHRQHQLWNSTDLTGIGQPRQQTSLYCIIFKPTLLLLRLVLHAAFLPFPEEKKHPSPPHTSQRPNSPTRNLGGSARRSAPVAAPALHNAPRRSAAEAGAGGRCLRRDELIGLVAGQWGRKWCGMVSL